MSSRGFSIMIMVGMTTVFIAIDVALAMNRTEGDTYSEIIRQAWWQAPIVGLAFVGLFGTLAGHWFKPRPDHPNRDKVAKVLAVLASLLFLGTFLAGYYYW